MSVSPTIEDAPEVPIEDAVAQLEGDESTSDPSAAEAADTSDEQPSDPNEVDLSEPEASEASEETPNADDFAALREMVKGLGYKDAKSFIDGLHESWRSSKEMRQELAALREELTAQEYSEAEPEPDPDVVYHEENITTLKGKVEGLVSQENTILQQITKVNTDLARTQGRLDNADDSERASLEAAVSRLESKIESLSDKWNNLNDKRNSISEDIRKEERELTRAQKAAEKAVQSRKRERQQQQEAEEAIRTQTRQEFDTTVDSLLEKTGWSTTTKGRQKEAIRGMVLGHLRALGKNGPAQDIPALTKAIGEAHIESLGEITRSKFANASRAKVASAKSTAPRPGEPPPPPAPSQKKRRRDMTQGDWEAQKAAMDRYYSRL